MLPSLVNALGILPLIPRFPDYLNFHDIQMASTSTILITGASGFLGGHILSLFLEAGYTVTATVRTQSAAEMLGAGFHGFGSQLAIILIPDITQKNAFDHVVKNVDGVIHVASPFLLAADDNERDILRPAIDGTYNLLSCVHRNNNHVKRVVITSSDAAVIDYSKGTRAGYVYTELDWNPISLDEALSADGPTAYCASKTLAEKATFDLVQQYNPRFKVTSVCPTTIYGPIFPRITPNNHFSPSISDFYRLMNSSPQADVPKNDFSDCVDVRDVAFAHFAAYEHPDAGNQRFLLSAGKFSYQMICDVMKTLPDLKEKVPRGLPGSLAVAEGFQLDGGKAERILGVRYRRLEDTVVDTVESLMDLERLEKGDTLRLYE